MKLRNLIVPAAIAAGSTVSAQNVDNTNKYLGVSAEAGWMLNSDKDKTFGLGGTVSFATPDFIFNSTHNYVTFGAKVFSNPYEGGKFISNVSNGVNDGLNYLALLAGYRFTENNFEEGWYVEPRIGFTQAGPYSGFIVAPKGGFMTNKWDFSLFADAAFGGEESNIGKKNFTSAGLSVGYFFGLNR